ncbi:hypothetical protein CKO25_03940 [Thiocapsa imhoffii]|uniref:Amidohydrolase-related domain-containing protein n=1 Tax=Thiocapsa imhoffii TaxID=382777 RepID=A0A9X0WGE9_9GAMM|nr:TatD family hydrolase [Thiocapsa imhoffii]MBK1643824.1 hypothetical protein [Thiocapsa imhoffii]
MTPHARNRASRVPRTLVGGLLLSLLVTPAMARMPLFDAHLHYSEGDAAHFTPADILARFDRSGIEQAIVTSTPPERVQTLYQAAPERIFPFAGLYRDPLDKENWFRDDTLPARMEQWLDEHHWVGIGEIHLFASHRNSPVFQAIVDLAARRNLVLMIHGDPEIIDRTFELWPQARILWAHLGTDPRPERLRDYLDRYPDHLWIDTSVRDERIAPEGRLLPEWRELFIERPDRFVIGVDTFSVNRWRNFDQVVEHIRGWLAQLPTEVAQQIGRDNARAMLRIRIGHPSHQ